jgi:hypothetical protein
MVEIAKKEMVAPFIGYSWRPNLYYKKIAGLPHIIPKATRLSHASSRETLGFPSPPHDGFGFIWGGVIKLLLYLG